MSEISLDPRLANRIKRYLHTGNEVPKYIPGCWATHKYYELEKLPALNEIFANGPNNVEVVSIIVKAYNDGWYTRFETIAFALAKCIKLGSPAVKEAVYKASIQICDSPEHLMIFNNFIKVLKTGNGRGWCKSVREWYEKKDPLQLVKDITRVRSRYGRTHKTLIRKSHVKIPPNDVARDAVVKYAVFGMKRAKQLMNDKEECKAVFDYIQMIEDMRHCEEAVVAAKIAEENQLTLEHVPGHLLTAQEVWNAVLPHLRLEQILCSIQRIHNMGFLTNDSETTAILISLLNNQDVIKRSKVSPLAVFIALTNYKKKSRPMAHAKLKVAIEKELRRRARQVLDPTTGLWEWTVTRRHPKEIKHWGIDSPPNQAMVNALTKLIDHTWLLTQPTNKRYVITLDMRNHMFKGRHFCKGFVVPKKGTKVAAKPAATPGAGGDAVTEKKIKKRLVAECFYNKSITPGHAAIILALQILKREKSVKIAVFTEDGIEIISFEKKKSSSIDEAEVVLRNAKHGRVQLDAPIEWAIKNKEKVDVFINMVDRTTRYMELDIKARGGRGSGGRFGPPPHPSKEIPDHCPVRALERYRTTTGVKDAKLIVMSLASHRVGTTDGTHEGVLDIVGVDEHVHKIMDAFVLGQFK